MATETTESLNPPGLDGALTEPEARRFRDLRRIGIAGIILIVVLASVGVFGQKTNIVTARGGGYLLSVTYPSVVRPGLDVRFEVTVSNAKGFGKTLTISFKRHYFDIFDLNSARPDADSSWSDASNIYYSWSALPGTSFHFSLDLYAEYGEHLGLDGATSVQNQATQVVTVRYHTRLVP